MFSVRGVLESGYFFKNVLKIPRSFVELLMKSVDKSHNDENLVSRVSERLIRIQVRPAIHQFRLNISHQTN